MDVVFLAIVCGFQLEQGDAGSSEIQVDKSRLVAKIVQLQTWNASLTNKMEFLQGHVEQLMTELRNKSRSASPLHCRWILEHRSSSCFYP